MNEFDCNLLDRTFEPDESDNFIKIFSITDLGPKFLLIVIKHALCKITAVFYNVVV